MARRLRIRRSGEKRPGHGAYVAPLGVNLENTYSCWGDGALGTWQTRPRRPSPEVLPVIPAEVRDHNQPWSDGSPGRDSALQGGLQRGSGSREHEALREPDRGWPRFLQERSIGRRARLALPLLHPGIHNRGVRARRSLGCKVHRLYASKRFQARRNGAHASRRPLCHHSLPHPLLSEEQVGHGGERRFPRLQLQDSWRRMALVGGGYGALRGGDSEWQADQEQHPRPDVDAAETLRWIEG